GPRRAGPELPRGSAKTTETRNAHARRIPRTKERRHVCALRAVRDRRGARGEEPQGPDRSRAREEARRGSLPPRRRRRVQPRKVLVRERPARRERPPRRRHADDGGDPPPPLRRQTGG